MKYEFVWDMYGFFTIEITTENISEFTKAFKQKLDEIFEEENILATQFKYEIVIDVDFDDPNLLEIELRLSFDSKWGINSETIYNKISEFNKNYDSGREE
jgi:hypothetical protein